MNMNKFTWFALVSAIIFTTAANALLGPIPIYLSTEYRTGSPVIGSISSNIKITAGEIEASGANSFIELLASIPSAGLVNPQGNVPAIFIRGNEAKHTLVLVDGININDISSTDGAAGHALKSISLNDIEKIEIIKGPASVLYGSGAIGGVIAITTKKGVSNKKSSVSISAGSNSTYNYSVSTNAGNGDNFIRLSFNNYSTDGISAKTDNTEKDGVEDRSANLKAGYKLGNTKFIVNVSSSDNDTLYDACYPSGSWTTVDDCTANKTTLIKGLSIDKDISDTWNTKLTYNTVKQSRQNKANGVADAYGKDFKKTDLTLINSFKRQDSLLNVGLSKITDKDITASQTLSSKDAFISLQKNINTIDFNAGVRFIDHSDFGNKTIYNLGLAQNLSSNTRLTGSYGTAFYAPTIYQINYNTTANLKPETSNNFEIGVSSVQDWGSLSAKYYKNQIKNIVVYAGSWPSDYFKNEDKLNIKGIEVSMHTTLKDYDISLTHNYVDSKLEGATTQQLRRPKHSTNFNMSKQFDKLFSNLQVIKKSSSLDTGSVSLEGYTLFHLNTHYDYNESTKISLNINNLLDKSYTVVSGYNQLGRTVKLGVTYSF